MLDDRTPKHRRHANGTGLRPQPSRTCLVLALILLPIIGDPTAANAGRYTRSQRPHWEVGDIDADLSRACRRGRFNQVADHRLHIAYRGEKGAGVTGIAKRGWNLRDPNGLAQPGATYHFADDGYSTCRVYVARDKAPGG
jgi:hypothetical protein